MAGLCFLITIKNVLSVPSVNTGLTSTTGPAVSQLDYGFGILLFSLCILGINTMYDILNVTLLNPDMTTALFGVVTLFIKVILVVGLGLTLLITGTIVLETSSRFLADTYTHLRVTYANGLPVRNTEQETTTSSFSTNQDKPIVSNGTAIHTPTFSTKSYPVNSSNYAHPVLDTGLQLGVSSPLTFGPTRLPISSRLMSTSAYNSGSTPEEGAEFSDTILATAAGLKVVRKRDKLSPKSRLYTTIKEIIAKESMSLIEKQTAIEILLVQYEKNFMEKVLETLATESNSDFRSKDFNTYTARIKAVNM